MPDLTDDPAMSLLKTSHKTALLFGVAFMVTASVAMAVARPGLSPEMVQSFQRAVQSGHADAVEAVKKKYSYLFDEKENPVEDYAANVAAPAAEALAVITEDNKQAAKSTAPSADKLAAELNDIVVGAGE